MSKNFCLLFFITILCLPGCAKKVKVTNYEECVAAGYPILETYPAQCKTPNNQTFVQELNSAEKDKLKTGLANPASVFCVDQGGVSEIRTAEDSGQSGVCKFNNGSECDEWAFYRGECAPDKIQTEIGEQESQKIAETWIITKSPTYQQGGKKLLFEQSQKLACPDCYQFTFSFEVKQVHTINIDVEKGRVIKAVSDGKFDEIKNQPLN